MINTKFEVQYFELTEQKTVKTIILVFFSNFLKLFSSFS